MASQYQLIESIGDWELLRWKFSNLEDIKKEMHEWVDDIVKSMEKPENLVILNSKLKEFLYVSSHPDRDLEQGKQILRACYEESQNR